MYWWSHLLEFCKSSLLCRYSSKKKKTLEWSCRNLRGCLEKVLFVTQAAQSSDSDTSDFTQEEGAMFLRLPAGGYCISRHRNSEFTPRVDTAPEPGLQSLESRRRPSVFHPDMSASTLNGCRRQATGSRVFCSVVSTGLLSSSEELHTASLDVSREFMTPWNTCPSSSASGSGGVR